MVRTAKSPGFVLLLFLVTLAAAEMLLRGPLRVTSAGDLASPYVAALRLIHGQNPYPSHNFLDAWHGAGAPANYSVGDSGQRPIYPPTALLIVAPLAALPWTWAVRCFVWACTLGYLGIVWLFARLVGGSWASLRRLAFVAFALGLAPIQAGIDQGNLSILVFVLCACALYLAYLRDGPACGILLALAFCIKPASALAAVLIVLLYRRKKSVLAFLGVSALIAGCTAFAMHHIGPAWQADYRSNLAFLFGATGAANFATQGLARFDLVNMQVPFYSICNSIRAANLLAWAVSAILALFWLLWALLLAILYASYAARYEQPLWYPYDIPHLVFFGLATAFVLSDRPLPFVAVFAVDALTRETSVFLIVLALLVHLRSKPWRIAVAAASLWWLLTRILAQHLYPNGLHSWNGLHWYTMIKPWHLPQLFSIAGFLWLPVWLGVKYLTAPERRALYAASAMIFFTFFFATWNETRAWLEWSVLFAILAAVELERSFAARLPETALP